MADEREDKTGTTLRVTGEGRTFRVTETGVELSRERSPFAPARTRRVAFGDVTGVEVEPARRRSLFRLGLVVVAVAIAHLVALAVFEYGFGPALQSVVTASPITWLLLELGLLLVAVSMGWERQYRISVAEGDAIRLSNAAFDGLEEAIESVRTRQETADVDGA